MNDDIFIDTLLEWHHHCVNRCLDLGIDTVEDLMDGLEYFLKDYYNDCT